MSTTSERVPLPPIPPRKGPLCDRLGRPVDQTPEDRAERIRRLRELFLIDTAEPGEPPDLDDQILKAIQESRR